MITIRNIYIAGARICVCVEWLALSYASYAEVVFDGSLGTHPNLDPLTGTIVIPDTRGTQLGANLFHSFSVFNVNTGESATFSGPASIANVLGRVTGPSASNIDGLLASTIPGANLWLINPNGIMFGPNASLNVDGSFHASTADYIGLADGGRFGANLTDPQNTMLTMANPTTFGFLDTNVGSITLTDTTLEVGAGEGLSLVGGDIELTNSTLTAGDISTEPGGRINVASIASAGEVTLNDLGIGVDDITTFGDIDMASSTLNADGQGGGNIYIRGGAFVMRMTSKITTDTLGDGGGGEIRIDVDNLTLSPDDDVLFDSRIRTRAEGPGDAGAIAITAADTIIIGPRSRIFSGEFVSRSTGTVTINTGNLRLTGGQSLAVVSRSQSTLEMRL